LAIISDDQQGGEGVEDATTRMMMLSTIPQKARDQAHHQADDQGQDRPHEGHGQGDAGAVDDPAQDVPPGRPPQDVVVLT
jgi:hypothetical protein